jgi:type II secretory pathway pseudopilin PulG
MLIVIAILGTIAAISLPNAQVAIAAFRRSSDRADFERQLDHLLLWAILKGADAVLADGQVVFRFADADEPMSLHVPAGWTVRTDRPIHYRSGGFCTGGLVSIEINRHSALRYRLDPPRCRATPA